MRLNRDTIFRLESGLAIKIPKGSKVEVVRLSGYRKAKVVLVNGLKFIKVNGGFYLVQGCSIGKVLPMDGERFEPYPPFPLSLL